MITALKFPLKMSPQYKEKNMGLQTLRIENNDGTFQDISLENCSKVRVFFKGEDCVKECKISEEGVIAEAIDEEPDPSEFGDGWQGFYWDEVEL